MVTESIELDAETPHAIAASAKVKNLTFGWVRQNTRSDGA